MEPPNRRNNKEFDRRMKSSIKRLLLMLFILLCIAYPIVWEERNEDDKNTRIDFTTFNN